MSKRRLMRPVMYTVALVNGFVLAIIPGLVAYAFAWGQLPGVNPKSFALCVFLVWWAVVAKYYMGKAWKQHRIWYGR